MYAMSPIRAGVNEWLRIKVGGEREGRVRKEDEKALALIGASRPPHFSPIESDTCATRKMLIESHVPQLKIYRRTRDRGRMFLRISNPPPFSSSIDRLQRVITSHGRGGDRFPVRAHGYSIRGHRMWDMQATRRVGFLFGANTRKREYRCSWQRPEQLFHWARNEVFGKLSGRDYLRIIFWKRRKLFDN